MNREDKDRFIKIVTDYINNDIDFENPEDIGKLVLLLQKNSIEIRAINRRDNKINNRHNIGNPAKYDEDGTEHWFFNGNLHRDDGPSRYNPKTGLEEWHKFGDLHREDGPAVTMGEDHKEWWYSGKRHRVDGPAIVSKKEGIQWYYYHESCEFEDWCKYTARTDEQIVQLKLEYIRPEVEENDRFT